MDVLGDQGCQRASNFPDRLVSPRRNSRSVWKDQYGFCVWPEVTRQEQRFLSEPAVSIVVATAWTGWNATAEANISGSSRVRP